MAKVITVEIAPDGNSFDVDLTGFHGKGCKDVLKVFANIGGKAKSEGTKPEFRQDNIRTVCK